MFNPDEAKKLREGLLDYLEAALAIQHLMSPTGYRNQ